MDSEQLLSQAFVKAHPEDAAKLLEQLPFKQTAQLFTDMPADLGAKVTKVMAPSAAAGCLEMMQAAEATELVKTLPVDIALILLRRLEHSKRQAILKMLPAEKVKIFNPVLKYPENNAGALMDPQVFTLFDDVNVRQALRQILKHPKHVFYHLPVINRDHVFGGLTNIRELILAEAKAPISSVMHTGVGHLLPTAKREAILAHPDWLIFHDLPVVDEENTFLGLIHYQVLRGLQKEAEESQQPARAHDAGKALGELYWIGMSALFKGATVAANTDKKSTKKSKGGL